MGLNKSQVVILLQHTDGRLELWGGLAEICRNHDYKYNILIRKKYPFNHDDWTFSKIPFRAIAPPILGGIRHLSIKK